MDLFNGWDWVCNKDLARGQAWVNGGDLAKGRNLPDPSHQAVELVLESSHFKYLWLIG